MSKTPKEYSSDDGEQALIFQERSDHVTYCTKFAYGVGEAGYYSATLVFGMFFTPFLLEVVGISPYYVGTISLILQLWDAITDPIVGKLSDISKCKMGRRRPWLLFASIPMGLSYFLVWQIPWFLEDYESLLVLYYFIACVNMSFMITLVSVPYTAMTPELSRDYHVRTVLTTYRQVFGLLSGIGAAFVHSLIIEIFPDYHTGYTVSAFVFGTFISFPTLITFCFVQEKFDWDEEPEETSRLKFITQVKLWLREVVDMFKNWPFFIVTYLFLCCWLSTGFVI